MDFWRTVTLSLRILGTLLCIGGAALWALILQTSTLGCFALGVAFGGAAWHFTGMLAWQEAKRCRKARFTAGENSFVFFLVGMIVLVSLLLGVCVWSVATAEDVYDLPLTTTSGTLAEDADYGSTRQSEWFDLTLENGEVYTISETIVRRMDRTAFEEAAQKGARVQIVSAQGHLFGKASKSVFGLTVNEETWLRTEESQSLCAEKDWAMGYLGIVACAIELSALILLLVLWLRERRAERYNLF